MLYPSYIWDNPYEAVANHRYEWFIHRFFPPYSKLISSFCRIPSERKPMKSPWNHDDSGICAEYTALFLCGMIPPAPQETMENRLGPLGQCQLRRGEGWITLSPGDMCRVQSLEGGSHCQFVREHKGGFSVVVVTALLSSVHEGAIWSVWGIHIPFIIPMNWGANELLRVSQPSHRFSRNLPSGNFIAIENHYF